MVEVLAPYALDKCTLLAGVAGALRCQCVRRQGWSAGRKTFAMHLFGHDTDLRRVEVLFTSLLVQASFALVAASVPSWENVAAYRRSWFAGYTQAIVVRLRDPCTRRASVALVLADRSAAVTERVAAAYPRLRFAGPRRLAGSGMGHGYAAGRRADIGTTRVRGGDGRAGAIDAR